MNICLLLLLFTLFVDVPALAEVVDGSAVAPERHVSGPMNGRLYDALPLGRHESLRLKCFVPEARSNILCVLGGGKSQKQRIEDEKRETRQRSFSHWLREQNKNASRLHDPIFKNDIVSYVVSFDGITDTGNLRLSRSGSDAANERALRIIRRITPLVAPPGDAAYRRGLLFRFTSRKLEIGLAPEH